MLCSLLTVGTMRRALIEPRERPWQVQEVHATMAPTRGDLGEIALQVIATDPFRLDRRPAEVPFGATVATANPVQVAPTVSGILGPPWKAVLEGVAGRQGSVLVAKGDTLGGLRIISVREDQVVIQAKDTTWRLGVRKAW